MGAGRGWGWGKEQKDNLRVREPTGTLHLSTRASKDSGRLSWGAEGLGCSEQGVGSANLTSLSLGSSVALA